MTTSYNDISFRGRSLYIFIRILSKWKGSLYKLIWMDLLIYLGVYYFINLIYRFALSQHQRKAFIKMVQFADEMKQKVPFFFILGFFVAGVVTRWIRLYMLIPWLQRQALIFEGYVNGNEALLSRRLRKTLLRYLNLAWILQMYRLSDQIASRFNKKSSEKSKTTEDLTVREILISLNNDSKIQETYGKIITNAEIKTFESIAVLKTVNGEKYLPEYWVPLQWASRVVQKCFFGNYVGNPGTRDDMIKELENVRNSMQGLQIFCQIMIPLVYTQVVIIAVYSFFACELLASQFIDPSEKIPGYEIDTYFPFFTVIQFLFLMGWLKVAMCVMNPFGDDEEDFQTSNILDINLDCTFRSVCGESYMYPDKLDAPKMVYEFKNSVDNFLEYGSDNLETFLDDIDSETNDLFNSKESIM